MEGEPPTDPKYVLIAAPHTSNWDFPYMLAMAMALGVRISWVGKESLFRGPMGWMMRRLGGISVRRGERSGSVSTLAERFAAEDKLVIVVPAEGTRDATDHWKSGFYRIAHAAGVPIVCGYLDYGRRTGGFGSVVYPTDNLSADMDKIRAFYSGMDGKYPDQVGVIRLREEDRASDAPPADAPPAIDG